MSAKRTRIHGVFIKINLELLLIDLVNEIVKEIEYNT